MLNNMINDLRNLEGMEVGKNSYFHQIYTNNTEIYEISIIDIMENLKQFEIENLEIMRCVEDEEGYEEEICEEVDVEEYLDFYEYELIKADNSYNWLAPVSNHFNYRIYKSEILDNFIVEFSVHRFGDVRCNYTENAYLEFNSEYEFYDALMENGKYFTIKDKENEKEYSINIDIFSDCPSIEKFDVELNEIEYIDGYDATELLNDLLNMENIEIIED